MLRKFYLFFVIFLTFVIAQQKPLPHYLTKNEKSLIKDYLEKSLNHYSLKKKPDFALRAIPEWEEKEYLLIVWDDYFADIFKEIIEAGQKEGTVVIIASDSSVVKNKLQYKNISLENLSFLNAPTDAFWIRDFGPLSAYSAKTDSLYLIDWKYNRPRPNDDVIPIQFADKYKTNIFSLSSGSERIIGCGGNFMHDGYGNAFSSKLILQENNDKSESEINDIMKSYLGINNYTKFNTLKYDKIHHIDMHMKLLDEETILIGQYPEGVSDGPDIEKFVEYIKLNLKNCYGRDYKIVRIPMPPDANNQYPNKGGDYRTYTNSLIFNKTVMIPTYDEKYDTTAMRIYKNAMPGYKLVGINSNNIIYLSGAIHCITRAVGYKKSPGIYHIPPANIAENSSEIELEMNVSNSSSINKIEVYYKTNDETDFNKKELRYDSNEKYSYSVPVDAQTQNLNYYFKVTTSWGREITKPLTQPEKLYEIKKADITSISEMNNEIPEEFKLEQNYPNPFNPSTVIKYIIPSISQIGAEGDHKVTLKVFNLLGEEIKILVNKYQSVGSYEVVFDASEFSSGIYLYRLEVGSFTETKKMLLVK